MKEEVLREFQSQQQESISGVKFYAGKGCEYCKFTGYRGRTGIYEFLPIDDKVRETILKMASSNEIKKQAVASGMHTLRQNGWEKVEKGLTTLSEVIRVTQQEQAV